MPTKLKLTVDNLDDVDEHYKDLYTQKGDKFVFTGVDGMKTQSDVDAVRKSLTEEREAHKTTKEKYRPFEHYADDAETWVSKLDKYDELAAAAEGKLDEDKINNMVETRMKSKTAPLDRKITGLEKENMELKAENEALKSADRRRLIRDKLRESATKSKMLDSAVEDLLMYDGLFTLDEGGQIVTKDGVGVTPGVEPDVWITEMQEKRPHWWPASGGGGARPGGGGGGPSNNPFSHEHWNRTAQAQLFKADPKKAEQYASAAGTTVNGARPAPRASR